jgi:ADP-heptose:LPS heptosyltransferase
LRSTSCREIARDLLARATAGDPPRSLPPALTAEPCGAALFGILAEGLADRFEPSLCDVYARLFSQAIAQVTDRLDAASLVARYERVRRTRPAITDPKRVFVLSRVTLGADVAVTSVLLDAAKRRFPNAEIVFVGPNKNYELFAADPRLRYAEVAYRRGGLRARLEAWQELQAQLTCSASIVLDPDSRLTQLGLLPVCGEENYHLFESRGYGGISDRPLPELAAEWVRKTLGSTGAKPYVALCDPQQPGTHVAVSFGVGENSAKMLPEPFEREVLAMLARAGADVWIDAGAGGEEAERVRRAVERSGINARLWEGSFAGFASLIAAARLYIGYDSAGQHVAAACDVPLISVFTGFPVPRMFERWQPITKNATVIRMDRPDVSEALRAVEQALAQQRS